MLCRHELWKWWWGLKSSADLRFHLDCNPGAPREKVGGDKTWEGGRMEGSAGIGEPEVINHELGSNNR